MRIPSPITWFGGKSRIAPRIIGYFPPHKTYVEPFGGSAAVLLAKEPSAIEVFNDIDKQLFNFFRVLRDEQLFKRLRGSLELTLYSRAEFDLAKQQSDDPVEAARRLLVRQRQSFSGKGEDWSYSTRKAQGGMASAVKRWRSGVDCLPAVNRRLQNAQIECDDWRQIIRRFDTRETLFYVDAPYHIETRVGGGYRHEITKQDHEELIARLLKIRGMVVLSGYNHGTYAPLERAGWKRVDFDVVANISYRRTSRIESLWMSPAVVNRKSNMFLSPTEKMRDGAYQTHSTRVESSTKRVVRTIEKFRASGQRITIVDVARATKMSREHLGKKYRHLFAV